MPWGRIDDNLYDHPKLERLGRQRLPALGLHLLALSYCNRWLTDGVLSHDRVRKLGGTTALAAALVAAGLWDEAPDGYEIHDFLIYNDSKATVLERREQARNAGRLGGQAKSRASTQTSDASLSEPLNGASTNARARPVPSLPISIPVLSRRAPAREAILVDERELSPEQRQTRYDETMKRRLGIAE